MTARLRRISAFVLVTLLLLSLPRRSYADVGYVSDSKAAGVIAGAVGAVAVIGLVAYFVLRTPRTTGCTVSTASGFELQTENSADGPYVLNDPSGLLKPGEHVRIIGKKSGPRGKRKITVTRVGKDFGSCSAAQPASAH